MKDIEGAVLVRVSQEHESSPAQGMRTIDSKWGNRSNHSQLRCPVVNLADTLYLMRDGRCECALPVEGRGKNR